LDGRRLAAGLGGANGIRVWDTATWQLTAEDKDYGDNALGLAYSRDGRLAATSYDGHIRLYGADGRLRSKVKAPGGQRPLGIAFSPDDARLAVGYTDAARVDVLDPQTLAYQISPDTKGIDNGSLSSIAWLGDGTRLVAAGRYQADGRHPILIW